VDTGCTVGRQTVGQNLLDLNSLDLLGDSLVSKTPIEPEEVAFGNKDNFAK